MHDLAVDVEAQFHDLHYRIGTIFLHYWCKSPFACAGSSFLTENQHSTLADFSSYDSFLMKPMISNNVELIFESLLIKVNVLLAFNTNLPPIMLLTPHLYKPSAICYANFEITRENSYLWQAFTKCFLKLPAHLSVSYHLSTDWHYRLYSLTLWKMGLCDFSQQQHLDLA